jgi:hypothetical protein
MLRHYLNCLILLFTLAYLSIAQANEPLEAEPLLGLQVDEQGVLLQVASNGCTQKDSFSLSLAESTPMQIQLLRQQPDYCKAFLPYGISIRFTYAELNLQAGDQFSIANPLVEQYAVN